MRVVVAGAGVAGALAARGLSALDGVDVVCLERATTADHDEAGTGLNVGPNALKSLGAFFPGLHRRIVAASLPWRRWTIDLTDGTRLFDLDLATVADNPGFRIRWAELYRLLREDLPVRYGAEVTALSRRDDGRVVVCWRESSGETNEVEADLVIAADGRYSAIRERVAGPKAARHLGVSMYRLLFTAGPGCPIDDYAQWFNGPNRLLAFTIPGALGYIAGTFPIVPAGGEIPPEMKNAETLTRIYMPDGRPPCPAASFLIDSIRERVDEIHWARAQEDDIRFTAPGWPVLMVGDSAHAMVPTLGQGATQAIETACSVVDVAGALLEGGRPLSDLPAEVERRRAARVDFVARFSWEASDTMIAGADPVAGTLAKNEPAFRAKLARLYRDVPMPRRALGSAGQAAG